MITLGNFTDRGPMQRNIEATKHKVTLRKISTCLLAGVCLTVCSLPHLVFYVLALLGKLDWRNQSAHIIHLWADTFQSINSTLNCLIFFYKNGTLRRHGETIFVKYLSRMTGRINEWFFPRWGGLQLTERITDAKLEMSSLIVKSPLKLYNTLFKYIYIWNGRSCGLPYVQITGAYDLTSLSEKTRKSHHLQLLL